MPEREKIEKELEEFNFLSVHKYTNVKIYTLVEEAKAALYHVYTRYEDIEVKLPIIYTHGRYQVIVSQAHKEKKYQLQYVI